MLLCRATMKLYLITVVILSVNLSFCCSADQSTSDLSNHLVLKPRVKYQIKVGDILRGKLTKLVKYKTSSPVMYQLRVRTAGALFL